MYNDLNDIERDIVDTMVSYELVAEQCAMHLRQFDQGLVTRLWGEGQAIFMSDPVKYPCIPAPQIDTAGRNQFRRKCLDLCFPPESKKPRRPQECVSYRLNPLLLYNSES